MFHCLIKGFTDKSIHDFKQYNIKVALVPGVKLKSLILFLSLITNLMILVVLFTISHVPIVIHVI